ncbi:MAG TPA: N-acetyl-gamma-glutamyl-phosphate reductase [Bacteroidetes bacterium]|nr:N-acetyl-gamma-glutamyl-phosphate reductase [Bacteroidota bacterium]
MIRIGIIGGAGYVAGELIRILIDHPESEIIYATSNSQQDKLVSEVHTDLIGDTALDFSKDHHYDVDVIFLCGGHGNSKTFIENNPIPDNIKVIDMSADHRLDSSFVYGLPEVNKNKYGNRIANPGCYATAIQLGLIPLAAGSMLNNEVHVHAITGSTGAGQSLSYGVHYSWRAQNVSVYKPFVHQHLAEIGVTLNDLQGNSVDVNFIPMRGAFTRGIFTSMYINSELNEAEAKKIFTDFYAKEPFVHISNDSLDLKRVVNTNKCIISVQKIGDKIYINSIIDNLLKGASGQAVQNMNILFGFDEKTGLELKSSYF